MSHPTVVEGRPAVLLRKVGRPADSPSAYRPIVLLDKVAKLFERIITGRLINHLEIITGRRQVAVDDDPETQPVGRSQPTQPFLISQSTHTNFKIPFISRNQKD